MSWGNLLSHCGVGDEVDESEFGSEVSTGPCRVLSQELADAL